MLALQAALLRTYAQARLMLQLELQHTKGSSSLALRPKQTNICFT